MSISEVGVRQGRRWIDQVGHQWAIHGDFSELTRADPVVCGHNSHSG